MGARIAYLGFLLTLGACRNATPAPRADSATPTVQRMHDHTPHHGGVVTMVGMLHLEARAESSGRVLVYVSDLWRAPIDPAGASGIISAPQQTQWQAVALHPAGDHLEAQGAPFDGKDVAAQIDVRLADGQQPQANFVLPLASTGRGAAGLTMRVCEPLPQPRVGSPRCALHFDRAITALAASGKQQIVIAAIGSGVTLWSAPDLRFEKALAAAPALPGPSDEQPHPDIPNAVAVAPDANRIATAAESRALVYSADGALQTALPPFAAPVRALAWGADAQSLWITTFYSRRVVRFDIASGTLHDALVLDGEAAALALDSQLVAVARETGGVVLFDMLGKYRAQLEAGHVPARALTLTKDLIVSIADDGVLRTWRTADASVWWNESLDEPLAALAISDDGRRAATAGVSGTIYLFDLQQRRELARLEWHTHQILALAWSGEELISGDVAGNVAVWPSQPPG